MSVKPCQHRRRTVSGYCATGLYADGNGKVTRWGVIEDMKCVKCGDVQCRWSVKGYGARTAREALKRYGVLEPELPAPANHKDKGAVEAPLTSWPFPVSVHSNKPNAKKRA